MAIKFNVVDMVCGSCGMFVFRSDYVVASGRRHYNTEDEAKAYSDIAKAAKSDMTDDERIEKLNSMPQQVMCFCPICGKVHVVEFKITKIPAEELKSFVEGTNDSVFNEYGYAKTAFNIAEGVDFEKINTIIVPTKASATTNPVPRYWVPGGGYAVYMESEAAVMSAYKEIERRKAADLELEGDLKLIADIAPADLLVDHLWFKYDHFDEEVEAVLNEQMNATESASDGGYDVVTDEVIG